MGVTSLFSLKSPKSTNAIVATITIAKTNPVAANVSGFGNPRGAESGKNEWGSLFWSSIGVAYGLSLIAIGTLKKRKSQKSKIKIQKSSKTA